MSQLGPGLPPNVWGGTISHAYYMQAPSSLVRVRSGDFEVNLQASLYRRGLPYSSAEGNVEFDDGQSFEMDRSLRADIRHQAILSALAQLTSRVYADSFDFQRRVNEGAAIGCVRSDLAYCQYYDAGVAQWAGVEERLTLNWLKDQSLVTMAGVDARVLWVGAKQDMLDPTNGRLLNPTLGRIDETGGIVSPYLQQTYTPASFLDLNAGVRLDVDNRYAPVLSPRGAVAFKPLDRTTVKVIYSQAFRAPTYAETGPTDYTHLQSSGLDPETVRSLEASIEQRFATHRIVFGVFRTWWDNLIELVPAPPGDIVAFQSDPAHYGQTIINAVEYKNVAGIDNYGFNGGWDGSLFDRKLRYGLNATGAFTRLDQGGVASYPALAPQVFGNAHVTYAFGRSLPTVSLAAFGTGPRAADRPADAAGRVFPAAPASADLRLAVVGRVPPLRAIGYTLSADYITASYSPYTAGPTVNSLEANLVAQGLTPSPPAFVPIDQLRIMLGLRFDFAGGSDMVGAGEVQ